ncbi:hypothetical protein HPY31_08900 [Brevibacillus sp. HB1.3]|uniref:hypothetical protein n=1 Tax=Brevibacillus sp. HB1.3 TaxID=2738842 RepID=UPI001552369B|nr:hypothetical protein [Brevibacillus sp. HB1.3]NQF14020.1 hypothetical protein [Brevibacillus sp. HB1.3]
MKMTDLWSLYEADKRILVKGYYFAMIDDFPDWTSPDSGRRFTTTFQCLPNVKIRKIEGG